MLRRGLRALPLLLWLAVGEAAWSKGYGRRDVHANRPQTTLGAIHGPLRICAGTEAVFSVDALPSITSYSWTLPPGMQALSPLDGPTIRVLATGGGGNITVFGNEAGGPTSTSTQQVIIDAYVANRVLLVVGAIPLNTGDQALKTRLQTQGYPVLEVVDSLADTSFAGCASLIYISSSCRTSAIGSRFRSIRTPVIVGHARVWEGMGMVAAGAASSGTSSGTSLVVINNSHELGATNPTGLLTVYASAGQLNWGQAGAGAVIIANNPTGSNLPALFGYEQGTVLAQGGNAPERRVGFFADADGQGRLSILGFRLLDRALCWSLRGCASPGTSLSLQAPYRNGLCPGDTITLSYTASGTFGTGYGNSFAIELSNTTGAFVGQQLVGSASGTASGRIRIRIPFNTPPSTSYALRITSTNPGKASASVPLTITTQPPLAPASISGTDTVCTALLTHYTAAAVPGAYRYDWLLPTGLTTTDTTQTALLHFSGAPDQTTVTIQVRAVTLCGPGAYASRTVRIDNSRARPHVGLLSATPATCPGVYTYSVSPVPDATRYIWILPPGTSQAGQGNQIEATYDSARTGQVKLVVETACGQSDTARLNVNVPTGGKRALLYAPFATLGPTELSIKQRLEAQGYVVTTMLRTTPIDASALCNKLVVVSPNVNSTHSIARLAPVALPVLATHSGTGTDQLSEMKLAQPGQTGSRLGSALTITNAGHPLAAGLVAGFSQVYQFSYQLGWATPEPSATVIANFPGFPSNKTLFSYEAGDQMVGLSAPARRVGFFMDATQGLNNMTPSGLALFDRAVCYLAGNCAPDGPSILSTPLSSLTVCAGDSFRLPFITQGLFDTTNIFQAQLSDRTGSFATPLLLTGQFNSRRGGSFYVRLPDTLTASSSYQIRIIASAPADIGSPAPAVISIQNPLLNLRLVGDSLCPGAANAIIRLYRPQAGGQYVALLNGTGVTGAQSGVDSILFAIPANGLRLTPPDTVRIRVTVPSCPARLLAAAVPVSLFPIPDTTGTLSDLTLCGQDSGTIILSSSQAGRMYQLMVDGTALGIPRAGTGAALTFTIRATRIRPAGSRAWVNVRVPSCRTYPLRDTAQLRSSSALRRNISLSTDTVCAGQPVVIRLGNTQPGIWYKPLLAWADSVRATGSTAQITIPNALFAGVSPIRVPVLARSPFCGDSLLLDSALLMQRVLPALGSLSAPSIVCKGSVVRLRIQPVSPYVLYTVLLSGTAQTPTASQYSGDTLLLDFATTAWPVGNQSLQFKGHLRGCPDSLNPGQLSVTVVAPPRVDFTASSPKTCYGDTVRVRLSGTEVGVSYGLTAVSVPVGTVLAGTGRRDSLSVNPGTLPDGISWVRVTVERVGCAPARLRDSVRVEVIAAPTSGLGLGNYPLCPGRSSIQVRSTQVRSGVMYRLLDGLGIPAATATGSTSGSVVWSLSPAVTPPGPRVYRVDAQVPGCRVVTLTDSAIVQVRPVPRLDYTLSGGFYCPEQAMLHLSNSDTGIRYQPFYPLGSFPSTAGTGTALDVPVAGLTASGIFRLRIQNAGCRDTLLSDTAQLTAVRKPAGRLASLTSGIICPGTSVSLQLTNTQAGTRYRIEGQGRFLEDTLSSGGTIRLTLPSDSIGSGRQTVYLSGDGGICFGNVRLDSVLLTIQPPFDTALHMFGSTVCPGAPLRVKLAKPQTGFTYEPFIRDVSASASQVGVGDTLFFTLTPRTLPTDSARVRFQVSGPCGRRWLRDSARVRYFRVEMMPLVIQTSDTLPCINYEGTYKLNLSEAHGVRWRFPQKTRARLAADSLSVQLLWTDYPLKRDSLTATLTYACNARSTAKRILKPDPACEPVYVPNIVTPTTRDGNHIWDVRGLDFFPDYRLQVFNTWGAVVYESKGGYVPWDGTSGGVMLPSATYYYVLQLAPGRDPITGSITIFNK